VKFPEILSILKALLSSFVTGLWVAIAMMIFNNFIVNIPNLDFSFGKSAMIWIFILTFIINTLYESIINIKKLK